MPTFVDGDGSNKATFELKPAMFGDDYVSEQVAIVKQKYPHAQILPEPTTMADTNKRSSVVYNPT